jgi:hypothetical protein
MRQYIGTPLRFEDVTMHVNCKQHKKSESSMTKRGTAKHVKGNYPATFVVPQLFSCQNVYSGVEVQKGDLWTQNISLTGHEFMDFKSTEWNTKVF